MSSFNDELRVSTAPARWPGVDTLIALLGREKDDEAPHLRLLLTECFVAVVMCVFIYKLPYKLSTRTTNIWSISSGPFSPTLWLRTMRDGCIGWLATKWIRNDLPQSSVEAERRNCARFHHNDRQVG